MSSQQSLQQTLEQERAANAWKNIEAVDKNATFDKKEFGSLVRGLPAMIQTDGLGQTLAFLKAVDGRVDGRVERRGNTPHITAYRHLEGWLKIQLVGVEGDLLGWLIQQNSVIYRRAAAEAQAYLVWLKRFAEAKGWK